MEPIQTVEKNKTKLIFYFFPVMIGNEKENKQLNNLKLAPQHRCCARLRLPRCSKPVPSKATRLPQTKALAAVLSSSPAKVPLSCRKASTTAAAALISSALASSSGFSREALDIALVFHHHRSIVAGRLWNPNAGGPSLSCGGSGARSLTDDGG